MVQVIDARHAIQYHVWATELALSIGRGLSDEHLALSSPGTAGTIAYCLAHIVGADQRYLAGLLGRAPERRLRESTNPPLAVVESAHARNREAWQAVLDGGLGLEDWISNPLGSPRPAHLYERPAVRRWVLLAQALHHGNDHRTHIASITGAHGLVVPELDVWAYADSVGDLRDRLP
jgi:uncharacterized damage-inducible protein DinB